MPELSEVETIKRVLVPQLKSLEGMPFICLQFFCIVSVFDLSNRTFGGAVIF